MIIMLLVLMSFQYTGVEIHEWVGGLMFVAVFWHQFLNRKWYAALVKGKYSAMRVLQMRFLQGKFIWRGTLGFLFMSMHMGMHFGMISTAWEKTSKRNKRRAVLKLLILLICGYGIYAFIQQGIGSYLFLQAEFYQWGKAPNVWVYNLQNICMMITAGVIIRILCLLLKKKSR